VTDSDAVSLRGVHVDSVADISKLHAASIFIVKISRGCVRIQVLVQQKHGGNFAGSCPVQAVMYCE
jgi:hypothetical protein